MQKNQLETTQDEDPAHKIHILTDSYPFIRSYTIVKNDNRVFFNFRTEESGTVGKLWVQLCYREPMKQS